MMTKQEILADLSSMTDMIATARDGLTRNELVNIDGIQEKLSGVIGSISDLAPEDAVEMKTVLSSLLADFKDFSEEVHSKITELSAAPVAGSNETG